MKLRKKQMDLKILILLVSILTGCVNKTKERLEPSVYQKDNTIHFILKNTKRIACELKINSESPLISNLLIKNHLRRV
jgi:hypothetical protein